MRQTMRSRGRTGSDSDPRAAEARAGGGARASTGVEGAAETCAGCGLAVAGGTAGCQAMFEEIIARDFSDYRYGRVHRLAVDTYCLQHPDRYCASGKSLAAHLTGLCWAVEFAAAPPIGQALLRWLNGSPTIDKPVLPSAHGVLTIGDVRGIEDPEAHVAAVERWARSTWAAYGPLQTLAREWVRAVAGDG